jgi:hypothetical protein
MKEKNDNNLPYVLWEFTELIDNQNNSVEERNWLIKLYKKYKKIIINKLSNVDNNLKIRIEEALKEIDEKIGNYNI